MTEQNNSVPRGFYPLGAPCETKRFEMRDQVARRSVAAVLLTVLLVGNDASGLAQTPTPAATPDSAAPSAPADAPALKGPAAWHLLVGNTVVAEAHSGGYTEYYNSDGSLTHLDKDGRSSGKWSIEGQKVCFDFPDEDDRSCVEVETDGKTGTFTDEDAARDTFQVLPGDAKGL